MICASALRRRDYKGRQHRNETFATHTIPQPNGLQRSRRTMAASSDSQSSAGTARRGASSRFADTSRAGGLAAGGACLIIRAQTHLPK